MRINKIIRLLLWTSIFLAVSSLVLQPTAAAISSTALKSILNNTPFYGDENLGTQAGCVAGSATADTASTGKDNQQTAFNFFKKMGLNDDQSAAIVGNLMGESGLQTSANQPSGPGMGIAQWSNPGRWNNLEDYANQQNADKFDINIQLGFVWQELTDNYSDVLTKFKDETTTPPPANFTAVEVGVGFFMGTMLVNQSDSETDKFMTQFGRVDGYESPGTPHMDVRLKDANDTLQLYGTGNGFTVTGTDAACGSVGAVDCTKSASSDGATSASASSLSQVRQNVVCIAQQELAAWKSGAKGPGTSYLTYSQGRDEEWCADFVSWVYNQAGYPMSSAKDGNVPSVAGVKSIGEQGGKFTYHDAGGYTPVPGDIIVHQSGESHVNLVTAVNGNNHTMTTIGGNQGASANSQSQVQTYDDSAFSGTDGITGYVSPNDGTTN